MLLNMNHTTEKIGARDKILNAALNVIRCKGYSATTVDDLCAEAGVTKGAFFHHFKSKEDMAVAAAKHWSELTTGFFKQAPYQKHTDPLDRLIGYIDFRKEIMKGEIAEFTCLVGTMVQEIHNSSPAIREACHQSIFGHAADVAKDVTAAKAKYAPNAKWSAEKLALHIQAVIQGSFILAKADNASEIAEESIGHLKNYIEQLFKTTKGER